MDFKKHDWRTFKYENAAGITGKILIFENGRSVDRFIFNDKENYKRILKLIQEKYGLTSDGSKNKTEAEKVKDEVDWLEKGDW